MRVFAAILLAGAALATLPLLGLPLFYESFLYLVFHWIILATSWNILSGYSGYFSFGHGAFFGAGMYTTATLASRFDVPFLWTLPAAALVAMLLGAGLGAVVFRAKQVRGELFALVTLAVTFVVGTIVLNTPIDGGPGVYLSGVPVPKIGPSAASSFYLMGLAAAVATIAIAWAIHRSRLGTGLFAIHDDEDVAEVLGVPTFGCKMAAFAVSCALAGLAGGIHALFVSYVTAGETFSITVPLTVVLMSVLGGTRHWAGPAVGATIITALLYAFTAGNHAVAGKAVFGAVLIAVILFMPGGVLGTLRARRPRKGALRAPSVLPAGGDASNEAEEVAVPSAATKSPAVARTKVILAAAGLSRSFSGVRALDCVDIEVREGEILGLLGPNGSGKSTFINLVSGHYKPDAGALQFEGRDLARLPAHRIARAGVARTYQIPRPFAHLTVLDNVALTAMFGGAALPRKEAVAEARRWLDFTGLADKADALPDDLNLHQRKFLELARALAARPRLLLLDEVLSGLTPGEINGAISLIRRIRDGGATIVFVEHVMRAVMALTDRIVVLDHGVVIAEGDASAVMQQSAVVTAFLGKAHA
ncbi:MAG: branched-chain amino acid ABC transporter ATP-binding protein/permease [Betaproteobacteria bacterium]|nr:branched-chain amino acid ABC transporter ATP-binding protein/permease [Betaproteobacteria bacterium]